MPLNSVSFDPVEPHPNETEADPGVSHAKREVCMRLRAAGSFQQQSGPKTVAVALSLTI